MKKIIAGDDIEIEVTLINEEGLPIEISDLEDIFVEVCEGGCFSSNLEIEKTNLSIDGNVLKFVLPNNWTSKNAGKIFNVQIVVIVDKTGEDQFPENTMKRSTILKDLFKIVDRC